MPNGVMCMIKRILLVFLFTCFFVFAPPFLVKYDPPQDNSFKYDYYQSNNVQDTNVKEYNSMQ